jgi:hypothetical protein
MNQQMLDMSPWGAWMDDRVMAIFAKLMQDVVGAALAAEKPFGYGHFDD